MRCLVPINTLNVMASAAAPPAAVDEEWDAVFVTSLLARKFLEPILADAVCAVAFAVGKLSDDPLADEPEAESHKVLAELKDSVSLTELCKVIAPHNLLVLATHTGLYVRLTPLLALVSALHRREYHLERLERTRGSQHGGGEIGYVCGQCRFRCDEYGVHSLEIHEGGFLCPVCQGLLSEEEGRAPDLVHITFQKETHFLERLKEMGRVWIKDSSARRAQQKEVRPQVLFEAEEEPEVSKAPVFHLVGSLHETTGGGGDNGSSDEEQWEDVEEWVEE